MWIVPWRCWCTGLRRDSSVVGADAGGRCGTSADRRGLGYPAEVVRAWLRRFAGCFKAVHAVFTQWFRVLDPNLVLSGLAGTD